MPIDPNIALGFRGVEAPNALASYAQASQIQNAQNQNALAQYQIEKARREDATTNAMNELIAKNIGPTGQINKEALFQGLAQGKMGAQILPLQKSFAEQEAAQANLVKTKTEAATKQTELFRGLLNNVKTPEQAKLWVQAQYADPILGEVVKQVPMDQALTGIPTDPKKFTEWKNQNALGMTEWVKRNTMTAHEAGQLAVSQGQLKLAQENAAKPVWNEAGQGWVAPPTKANPQGTFTPVPEVQATKDQRAAVKALKTAGYDVETGADEISKLIEKSTGGMAQQLGSAVAGLANVTTSGREAIGRLKTRANQISLDMLNGKLGAGISNDDRNFIVSTLGNVADPSIPAGERLAAWDEAKKRMVSSGMLPAPVKAPAAAEPATGVKFLGFEPAQ